MQIDLKVAELLSSRLCHDLVGPIGAVNNGMELMEDDEFGMAEEALKLATGSARQAAQRLRFYRAAYGVGGSVTAITAQELGTLIRGLLEHASTSFEWPNERLPERSPVGLGKLILNMVALAIEALPRGGSLGLAIEQSKNGISLDVVVAGQEARMRSESQEAMADQVDLDDLTPRNVQGYFTRLLARRLGGDLRAQAAAENCLRFTAQVPLQ